MRQYLAEQATCRRVTDVCAARQRWRVNDLPASVVGLKRVSFWFCYIPQNGLTRVGLDFCPKRKGFFGNRMSKPFNHAQ